MQSGLLTGTFTKERAASFAEDDWRRRSPEFQGDKLDRNLALAAALAPIAARKGVSVAALAVAWTLAWPGVSGAIVGARRPSQVDGWLRAAALDLSVQDLADIAKTIEATGAGGGPVQPSR